MAFRELMDGLAGTYPHGTTDRFRLLDAYERLLDGTIYDHLPHAFSTEYDGQTYVPILQRRPSAPFDAAKIITEQVMGLLFGDEQSPNIRCWDGGDGNEENPYTDTERNLERMIDECELDAIMMEAVEYGTVGSCCIIVRPDDDGQPDFEIVRGKFARPIFNIRNRKQLDAIVQVYPTTRYELEQIGYLDLDEDVKYWWIKIDLTADAEIRYHPLPDEKYQRLGQKDEHGRVIRFEVDDERSALHDWGEVNGIWIRNLGRTSGIDGPCTYGAIVDMLVEIDYLNSQIGRGIRYSADPMLAIKRGELANSGFQPVGGANNTLTDGAGRIIRSANNIIDVDPGGDAKMLEISGQGITAAGEHVKRLREWAMEVVGGLKSDAEHEKGVQSGKALEMLHQALVLLVKRQRIAYGRRGFLPLVKLIARGIERGILRFPDIGPIDTSAPMRLQFPKWMLPTGADLQATATALQTLAGGSPTAPVPILPRNTVTKLGASNVGVTDPNQMTRELEQQVEEDRKQAEIDAPAEADRATASAVTVAKAKPQPKGPNA